MKHLALTVLSAALCASANAQLTQPNASGSVSRAELNYSMSESLGALNSLIELPLMLPMAIEEQADWLAAESLFGLARFSDAEVAYNQWLIDNPASICRNSALLRVAECQLGQEQLDKAIKTYKSIDDAALGSDEASRYYYGYGLCALRNGKPELAGRLFERVEHPLRGAALYYLGVIAYDKGDFAGARHYFNVCATNKEPGRRRDVYLALLDLNDEAYDNAIATARRGLGVQGLTADEKATLERVAGEALWRLNRHADAIPHLERHMAIAPKADFTVRYLLGVNAYENGSYETAAELLSPVSEVSGILGQSASLELGQTLFALGRRDAAVMAFDRAVNASPSDPEIRRQALYNYTVAKFAGANVPFGSTTDTFEAFLREYPSGRYSDQVREYLALGYLSDEDYDRALERLEAIVDPSETVVSARRQILYLQGCRALNSGNASEALEYLNRAASIRGDRTLGAEIELWQARALAAKGDNTSAARRYASYLRNSNAKNAAVANYGLGYAEMACEHFSAADQAFAKAQNSRKFNGKELADILNRRGDIAYLETRFADAAAQYASAYAADPSTGDYACYQGARMAGYQRNYADELHRLEQFEQRFPGSSLMPEVLLERASTQISLGKPDDAITTYDRLIADYPLTSQGRRAYIQKAMVLLENGHRERAADAYKEVVRRYPSSEEASQASTLLRAILAEQDRGDEYIAFMNSVQDAPAVERSEAASLMFGAAQRALRTQSDMAPMKKFIADYPDAPEVEEAMAQLAETDAAADRLPEALQRWSELAERASTPSMALRARMGILRTARELGQMDRAGAAAEAVLQSSAASGATLDEATYTRALYLSEDSTKINEAISLWQTVADDTDNIYGAKSAYEAAEALNNLGRLDEAYEAAAALSSSRTPHKYWIARAFILQSDILAAQGKKYEAREYLKALVNNYPGDEPDIPEMASERLEQLAE